MTRIRLKPSRNLEIEGKDEPGFLTVSFLYRSRICWLQGKNIKIELDDSAHDYLQVCYDESVMIRRLSAYPLYTIRCSDDSLWSSLSLPCSLPREAEQNKVWVGTVEETAHQLGTPISQSDGLD